MRNERCADSRTLALFPARINTWSRVLQSCNSWGRHNSRYHRFGLDAEKLAYAKHDAIVMHPGPMNRGVEIDGTVADDIHRSVIQEQVEMGVAVRMAAMELLAENLRAGKEPRGVMV